MAKHMLVSDPPADGEFARKHKRSWFLTSSFPTYLSFSTQSSDRVEAADFARIYWKVLPCASKSQSAYLGCRFKHYHLITFNLTYFSCTNEIRHFTTCWIMEENQFLVKSTKKMLLIGAMILEIFVTHLREIKCSETIHTNPVPIPTNKNNGHQPTHINSIIGQPSRQLGGLAQCHNQHHPQRAVLLHLWRKSNAKG